MNGTTIEEHDIDVGDSLRLHVEASGHGPPLVLLHGFTGSARSWDALREPLAPANTILTVDLPGHGRSSAPVEPGRYALDRFARDLARVLDTLRIERVCLLGYSMGGRAALRFALEYGDRVAGLILESTSPGIDDAAARKDRARSDGELADFIEGEGIEAFVNRWESLPLWETQHSLSSGRRSELRAQRLRNDPAGLANSLRGAGAGVTTPVLDRLGTLESPVLIIAGALDSAYVAHGQKMARVFRNARLIAIEGAGHAVHLEKPDEFAAEVASFVGQIPSAGAYWL